jgi:hypothetical protein
VTRLGGFMDRKARVAIVVLNMFLLVSVFVFALNNVSALVIDSVSVADEIVPGETGRITIGLENEGDDDIEDVSVSLDLSGVPFAPFDSSSEYGIDEIREDKSKNAVFTIIALNNAKSGIYKIPVSISYKDLEDDEIKSKNSLISVVVNSKPIIDVSVEDGLLLKGRSSDLNIKITNKGLSDVNFLELEVLDGIGYEIISGNRQYIGDVDSDDFDSIEMKVLFGNRDSVVLPIVVLYKDDLNNEYRELFDIKLDVYSESRAVEIGLMEKNNTVSYVVGILFILILFYIYRRLRKRARNKKVRK